jgi:hypothetical protein
MLRSRPAAAMAKKERPADVVSRDRSARPNTTLVGRPALVRTHRFRQQWPMGLLPFRCLFRQLSPLERSHCQQGASALSVRELGKPIALRRFAQAIFTGFHLPHPHPKGGAFQRPPRPNQQLPPIHKTRLPCRRTADQWARAQCTKTCRPSDRWAVQFVRLRVY